MNLYLIRHGNTFEPDEKVVWAGSRNDLPLVRKGLEQAETAAKWLLDNNVKPAVLFCGPLARTRTFASIIRERIGLSAPLIDQRLNELDYGEWSGLTDAEVSGLFGEDALTAWRDEGTWPARGNWGKSEAEVLEETRAFLSDMADKFSSEDSVIAVTSNGRLKYFLKACRHNVPAGEISVKTGRICLISCHAGPGEGVLCDVLFWNKKPD